jgi:hypothetical protein
LLKNKWSDTFWINSPTNPKKEVIMTTQEKRVNRKLSIIELAEFLNNVPQACRSNGVSGVNPSDCTKIS